MAFAYCPECGERVYLGRTPWRGQLVGCDACEADLEVVSLKPPELDWTDDVVDDDDSQEGLLQLEMSQNVPA